MVSGKCEASFPTTGSRVFCSAFSRASSWSSMVSSRRAERRRAKTWLWPASANASSSGDEKKRDEHEKEDESTLRQRADDARQVSERREKARRIRSGRRQGGARLADRGGHEAAKPVAQAPCRAHED